MPVSQPVQPRAVPLKEDVADPIAAFDHLGRATATVPGTGRVGAEPNTRPLQVLAHRWARQLRGDAVAQKVLAHISRHRRKIAGHCLQRLTADIPSFHESIDPAIANESLRHAEVHFKVLALFAAGRMRSDDPFAYVRTHAVMRARQHFPLDAVLHAYRIGHMGCWSVLRDLAPKYAESTTDALATVLRVSEFFIEYTDQISSVLTEAYTTEEKLLFEQNTRSRLDLMHDLLAGVPPRDRDALHIAQLLGLSTGQPLRVFIARLPDSPHSRLPVDLLRLRSILQQALAPHGPPPLLATQNGEIVGVVADADEIVPPVLMRLERARESDSSLLFFIGVSAPLSALKLVPLGHAEAASALKLASPARPLVALDRSNLLDYLHTFIDESAARIMPSWAKALREENVASKGEVRGTLNAFAQASLHVKDAARLLRVHPNTIYFRLNRIKKLTGVDPRTFAGLTEILLALRVYDLRRDSASGSPLTRPRGA